MDCSSQDEHIFADDNCKKIELMLDKNLMDLIGQELTICCLK